ncbi:nucleotidyltransferase [Halothermothrix orenii]|uniref:tRNA(Met) cytidine acetate ligase n=1 Tax=Halothermothrix orenii (strain H 168 / OCM 544 / DSM 9562) TaxID=373903 RepID=TMCAL_HALOH|nr:nucleotidyltransferase [Halothermothrix orenii]B8CWV6.1 RecName: Full=tRNA(Met) cytidine acetate ligase [Halothermothrix orenii H 168]ACL69775.1 predicted nucleotidyltransferase [Halothermothrix orenii H 168]
MPVLGIITEYNPFHNGHLYHLNQARTITDSNAVICIMNGNFVQRGEPALIDKWARTRMALKNGVDLIIELPLIYGIRSAEYFAYGAVTLLEETKTVDYLVFGSESGNTDILKVVARILYEEPHNFKQYLKKYISQGLSFPRAREKALLKYVQQTDNIPYSVNEIADVIKQPNNILGIEYIKALFRINSTIKPVAIRRKGKGYHSHSLETKITSATAIRKGIYEQGLNSVKQAITPVTYKILKEEFENGKGPVQKQLLQHAILAELRKLTPEKIRQYEGVKNGLEYRFLEAAHNSGTLTGLIENIKNKNLTWTRIQRTLLHILFNIREKDFRILDKKGPRYFRVLGFNKKGEKLLSKIKQNSRLPLITHLKPHLKQVNRNSLNLLEKSLSYDVLSSDMYSLLYPDPSKRRGRKDFLIPVIKNI